MVVGMVPPPDLQAHAPPLAPLDEHHPLADVVDLKDLREVPEKKVSDGRVSGVRAPAASSGLGPTMWHLIGARWC